MDNFGGVVDLVVARFRLRHCGELDSHYSRRRTRAIADQLADGPAHDLTFGTGQRLEQL